MQSTGYAPRRAGQQILAATGHSSSDAGGSLPECSIGDI
ncbi:unnamed protein product, partial [Didymodactylos carnosus]